VQKVRKKAEKKTVFFLSLSLFLSPSLPLRKPRKMDSSFLSNFLYSSKGDKTKQTPYGAGTGGTAGGLAPTVVLALLAVLGAAAPPPTAGGGRRPIVAAAPTGVAPPPPALPPPPPPSSPSPFSAPPPALLYSQALLQNGHRCSAAGAPSQRLMHWRWNAWPHAPQTTGASSPGNLASGGQPSKAARQMPQTSSPASQVQEATARQCLMETRKGQVEGVGVAPGAASAAFSAVFFVLFQRAV
jgi:hypothetical protein